MKCPNCKREISKEEWSAIGMCAYCGWRKETAEKQTASSRLAKYALKSGFIK